MNCPSERAAEAMEQLLALRGAGSAGLLRGACAQADMDARYAALTGKEPPRVGSLYPLLHGERGRCGRVPIRWCCCACSMRSKPCSRRNRHGGWIDLLYSWGQAPLELDEMPVQQFVAQFVRNAAP